ncbi:hypothetical protein BJX64DRAFT_85244 [Aspergillus heterothallicus]
MLLASPLTIATALSLAALTAAQTCYNPDRTIASDAVPCGNDDDTFCCDSDAICLSSGYCLSATSQPYSLYRGSCTDSGWGDFCAYYCVNFLTGTNAPIISMGTNDDGRAIYCCGYQSANQSMTECANGDAPFVLEDAEMVFGRAALDNTSGNTSSSTDSGSSSTSSTTSPTATEGNGGENGGSRSDTETGASSSNCSNNDVAIGAGVGVPLVVLALSAVAWALLERRRRVKSVGAGIAPASSHTPVRELFIPPQRKTGPTELDQETGSISPVTLIDGTRIAELAGSNGSRTLR